MTLNAIIRRIKNLALAHNQVRTFKRVKNLEDVLNDKQTKYSAVFLQDNDGSIAPGSHAVVYNFRLWLLDLVHVSADADDNELDVQSDMVEVAKDLIAQMNNPNYQDWTVSKDNSMQLVSEELEDYLAGCYVDFSIEITYKQEICTVPSDTIPVDPTNIDTKVYDLEYIATGTEGTTLTIPALAGKKILLVTRENEPLHKVSNLPDSAEYTWDNTDLGLGVQTNAGQRFLILFRNY